ncbi:MAG TPA: AAA family ATPase [Armatimonadota bacterium]|jgi:ATP-dependent 26S proteasome regulatory subunit
MNIAEHIETLIRARYPIIYLISFEEGRVQTTLQEIARRAKRNCYVWTETMGLHPAAADSKALQPDKASRDPFNALEIIRTTNEQAIFVLQDFHPYLSMNYAHRSSAVRKLRDLVTTLHTSYKTIVLISPVLELPAELEKDVTVIDYPLPSLEELDNLLSQAIDSVQKAAKIDLTPVTHDREMILKAALGLTLNEADNVFAKCVVQRRKFDVDLIISEKEQLIRKSGLLEYFHSAMSMQDIGGLDLLKNWLVQRSKAFSQRAKEYGLPAPRGLLLTGVQGCGKSLAAKTVANYWRMPLLRLDVGRLFSGFIGSSEDNVRRAIKIAESIAPVVLWVDEIEKGMSGMRSSDSVDAGTTARVFSTLLTWLQEKTAAVFVVATANDITRLPPELLRKGRFDEVFFVDLPDATEREEILRIHLTKRRRNPKSFDMASVSVLAEGFSGSEMEQAVIAALYTAFALDRDIRTEDLVLAVTETVPISRTMEESITSLRAWSAVRARPASTTQRERTAAVLQGLEDQRENALRNLLGGEDDDEPETP